MALIVSHELVLPVGIRRNGQVFREVVIDGMRGHDQKLLMAGGKGKDPTVISKILARCVQEIGGLHARKDKIETLLPLATFQQMTAADREYLLTMILLLSREESIEWNVKCPSCGHQQPERFNFLDAEVMEYPDDLPLDYLVEVPNGFTISGIRYKQAVWRMTTGAMEENIAKVSPDMQVITTIASGVVKLPGRAERLTSPEVAGMELDDMLALIEAANKINPGLTYEQERECENCSHKWSPQLDVSRLFTAPKRKTTDPTETPALQFGDGQTAALPTLKKRS